MTDIATTEIVAYDEFRAQLAELKEYNDKAVFDYETPKGNKDARSHVHKLRKTKTAVDACRKNEKAASLAYGRKVDGEAKEIIGEIEEMISVHAAPILEIENREKQRVADILDYIESIRAKAENTEGLSVKQLTEQINSVYASELNEAVCQEFLEQAVGAKGIAIETLERLIAEQQNREDDQAELDRLRKETAERERKARDELIAKEAAQRATKEAEQAAKRQQEKAERAAEAAAKKREEQAAIDAEARMKREAEEKKKAAAAALAKRESNKRHLAKINNAAAKALVEHALLSEEQARTVVTLIATGEIPNVSIRY